MDVGRSDECHMCFWEKKKTKWRRRRRKNKRKKTRWKKRKRRSRKNRKKKMRRRRGEGGRGKAEAAASPLREPPANFSLLRPKLSWQGYKKEGHLLLSYLFIKKLRVQCSLLQHSLILTYYDSQPSLATVSTSLLTTTPSLKMFYLLFSLISNIQSIIESYGSAFRKSNFGSHFPSDHHLSLGLLQW